MLSDFGAGASTELFSCRIVDTRTTTLSSLGKGGAAWRRNLGGALGPSPGCEPSGPGSPDVCSQSRVRRSRHTSARADACPWNVSRWEVRQCLWSNSWIFSPHYAVPRESTCRKTVKSENNCHANSNEVGDSRFRIKAHVPSFEVPNQIVGSATRLRRQGYSDSPPGEESSRHDLSYLHYCVSRAVGWNCDLEVARGPRSE